MPTVPLGKHTITEDVRRIRALLNVTSAMGLAYLPSHTHSGPGDGGTLDLDVTAFIDGTQGSVLFLGAAGVVSQDNDNLFFDDASDYFGVGTLASPDRTIHGELDDASADTPLYVLRLTRTTSGTAAAGIGAGLEFETEDGGGGVDVLAAVQGISTDASAGAEHGALLLLTADVGDDGLAERCRVDHDGTLYPAAAGYDLGTSSNYWDIYTREEYFQGGTGTNVVQVPDNVADALHLQDAGPLEYLKVISTDAQPVVRFNDGGADIDFEVEASGVADALQVRGSDGQITLGALTAGFVKSDAGGVLSVGTIGVGDLPAHDLLSAQHGDTAANAVTRGSLVYGNSTPAWDELAVGSAGYILQSDGTDVAWADPAGALPISPVAQGDMLVADATPAWSILTLGAAAGYALVTTATTAQWDNTPTWTGTHIWDDGVGDSPHLQLVSGNNDAALIFLRDDASAGYSDLIIRLCDAAGQSRLVIQDNTPATAFRVDSDGNLYMNDGAWIGLATGPLLTFDDTNDYLEITGCDVGVGIAAPAAQLHVDQSDTSGAQPALLLDQGDESEECIKFSGDGDDRDIYLWKVNVTGTPTLYWEELEDRYNWNKGHVLTAGVLNLSGLADALVLDSDGDTSISAPTDDQVDLELNSIDQYVFTTTQLTIANIAGDGRLWLRAHGDVQSTASDIYAHNQLGLAADGNVHVFIDGDASGTTDYFSVRKDADTVDGSTELFRVAESGTVTLMDYVVHQGDADTYIYFQDDRVTLRAGAVDMIDCVEAATDYVGFHAGLVCINDTANDFQTVGLTINQGTNDDEALALKSPTDVAHGMTNEAEADTYLTLTKVGATDGGANLRGYTAGSIGVALVGRYTTDDATTTAASYAAVMAFGQKDDGAGNAGNVGAAANMFGVRARRGGSNETVMLVNEDGDLYLDATVHEGDWDGYDDAALLTGLRASLMPDGHPFRRRFAEWMEYARPVLEETGVVRYNADGRHFLELKALGMLTVDAVRQLYERCARYEQALLALGADPALLEA